VSADAAPRDVHLLVNFDEGFKDLRTESALCKPEAKWGFDAYFRYSLPDLQQLCERKLRIQCRESMSDCLIGEASIDLESIASGPSAIRLTMSRWGPDVDGSGGVVSTGVVRFCCGMRLASLVAIAAKELQLQTLEGRQVAGAVELSCRLMPEATVALSYNDQGFWKGPCGPSFETTLPDLLKAPDEETLRFAVKAVLFEGKELIGEAALPFRGYFDLAHGVEIPFKLDVTEDIASPPRLRLEGCLQYGNLPHSLAQMVGGCRADEHIEGGTRFWDFLPCTASLPAEQATLVDNGLRYEPQSSAPKRPRFSPADADAAHALPPLWEHCADPSGQTALFKYKGQYLTPTDPRYCPKFWEQRLSADGSVYYGYSKTRQTTYTDPRGLPMHYTIKLDQEGELFFKNHLTQAIEHNDPRDGQSNSTLTKWRQEEATRISESGGAPHQ